MTRSSTKRLPHCERSELGVRAVSHYTPGSPEDKVLFSNNERSTSPGRYPRNDNSAQSARAKSLRTKER